MTRIKANKIEYIADTPRVRKYFSPLVQPALDEIKKLHPTDRTPARMSELANDFNFHATPNDLAVAEELSASGYRWEVISQGRVAIRFDLRDEADAYAKSIWAEVREAA